MSDIGEKRARDDEAKYTQRTLEEYMKQKKLRRDDTEPVVVRVPEHVYAYAATPHDESEEESPSDAARRIAYWTHEIRGDNGACGPFNENLEIVLDDLGLSELYWPVERPEKRDDAKVILEIPEKLLQRYSQSAENIANQLADAINDREFAEAELEVEVWVVNISQ